jgi:DNA helicase-2/ATP-dependent DNA helicase PcrA
MKQESLFAVPEAPTPGPSAPAQADQLLQGLNPQQLRAVTHRGGPLLVVAGAGSGKTRVLTRRIAYLVGAQGVHPGAIMAITFTNKAAAEMRGRVVDLVGERARWMWVSTFHSACVRILRRDADALGFSKSFSIYDDADQKRLVNMICRDQDIDSKRYPVRAAMTWISNAKNDLLTPLEAIENAKPGADEIYADVYADYQKRLQKANALDFDDLIMQAVRLLQLNPGVKEYYQRRFEHVMVDEYQDTNYAQYMLIRELCTLPKDSQLTRPELMVVGDSDQSIYAFRGATIRNILDFEEDFSGADTVVLEQNYRSTQTVLSAANAVISHNANRPQKRLWSDAGDGDKIVGWVADTEHDEANFVATEIAKLADEQQRRYGDVAVFYRTNAQSRAIEEVFIRAGLPYRVIGGVRFYERKEIRDAIAYLRAIANPADEVSVRRILNEPKRGIGDRAEAAIEVLARQEGISFSEALDRAIEAPGISPRSLPAIRAFVDMMNAHRQMITDGATAAEVLVSILQASTMLSTLQGSKDPQDETRLENLTELVSVAQEFVQGAHTMDLPEGPNDGFETESGTLVEERGTSVSQGDEQELTDSRLGTLVEERGTSVSKPSSTDEPDSELGTELLEGMPEADDSLAAFLERIALVSDTDSLPDDGAGVVTLMTLHSAKGLEFDVVFLTGMEDAIFPHQRSLADPAELSEERRLAYVGITRARKQLYLTRALVRTVFGSPQHNPASRFIEEIPGELIDWKRTAAAQVSWGSAAASRWRDASDSLGYDGTPTGHVFGGGNADRNRKHKAGAESASFAPGDRVLHSTFGLGTVLEIRGTGPKATVDVDFGSAGKKRLAVGFAPMEKL